MREIMHSCGFLTIVLVMAFAPHSMADEYIADVFQNGRQIVVQMTPNAAGKWVGCTIWDGDEEVDLEAKKVSYMDALVVFFYIPDHLTRGVHDAVVSAWDKRVEWRKCRAGQRSRPCRWCQANGYHLESRIARQYFTIHKRR